MVPASITDNLAGLRYRERLLVLAWGAACWLTITLVLLAICAFVDWFIDRTRDTPTGVRLGMFFVQLSVAGLGGVLLLALPQIRWLPDAMLALWVEEKVHKYDHRLISAVQLNEPNADLGGMSRELVGVVTKEAEQITDQVGNFAQFADHARLGWAAGVLTPAVVLLAIPVLIWPSVCFALIARQFMLNVDIPHSVTIVSVSPQHWPSDEEIPLRFRVTGEVDEKAVGTAQIDADGMETRDVEIRFIHRDAKGAIFGADISKSPAKVTYSARLGDGRTKYASEVNIVERPIVKENVAYLLLPGYCGLKEADDKKVPIEQRRYEVKQPQGEVQGIYGSSVRVQARVQDGVEIHGAWLEILAADFELGPYVFENIVERRPMTISSDRRSVSASFDLAVWQEAYRVIVEDQHQFANKTPQTRELRLVTEENPSVVLLRHSFSDDTSAGGFDLDPPIPLGGRIPVPYFASHQYGIGRAELLYRFKEKHDSDKAEKKENEKKDGEQLKNGEKEEVKDPEWTRVPLPRLERTPYAIGAISEVKGVDGESATVTTVQPHGLVSDEVVVLRDVVGLPGANRAFPIKVLNATQFVLERSRLVGTGKGGLFVWVAVFDAKTGVFRHTKFDQQVPFYAAPSPLADQLGHVTGGGRYFLETKVTYKKDDLGKIVKNKDGTPIIERYSLIDSKGKGIELQAGDQLQYCVRVYAANDPESPRPPGMRVPFAESETRIATMVRFEEFDAFLRAAHEEGKRIERLELEQSGVFAPK